MAVDYDKFDKSVDLDGLKHDIENPNKHRTKPAGKNGERRK